MKKEIQQYWDMPDDRLEKLRKQFSLNVWLMLSAHIMMTGFFLYFLLLDKNYQILFFLLFTIVAISSGLLFCRQTVRYIELIQELKKLKLNEAASPD